MVEESYQNVFLIQIVASIFAEFEISEFEISRFDCILNTPAKWISNFRLHGSNGLREKLVKIGKLEMIVTSTAFLKTLSFVSGRHNDDRKRRELGVFLKNS